MLTTEQITKRKLGGSDTATILGVDPYRTPLELYYQITGEVERFDGNEATEAGEIMEPAIAHLTARAMSKRYGREIKLRRCNLTLSHPKYDWLTAHIDRDVVGEERLVEIKNVGWRMQKHWGSEESDHIPEYYLPQVHHYLLVKDYPAATVAAYFGGADLRLYEVERDREMDDIIIEHTRNFWANHVLKNEPPPVDYSHATTVPLLKRVYKGTNGEQISASEEIAAIVERRREAEARIKAAERDKDTATAAILEYMREAAVLVLPDGSGFTRRQVSVPPQQRDGYTFTGLYPKAAPKRR